MVLLDKAMIPIVPLGTRQNRKFEIQENELLSSLTESVTIRLLGFFFFFNIAVAVSSA